MDDLISRKALLKRLHEVGSCGAPPESWADGYDKTIDLAYGMAENAPAVDAETLPIVRELRDELARVTVERDAAVADCFKFIDSKGVVNVIEKDEKGQAHTRAIWFLEWEDWIGLLRRK